MIQFLIENKVVILGLLFSLSEVLSLIPSVKANGVFQLMSGLVAKALGKKT